MTFRNCRSADPSEKMMETETENTKHLLETEANNRPRTSAEVGEKVYESRWRENYGGKCLNNFVFGFRLIVCAAYGGMVMYSIYKLYFASYELRHYLHYSSTNDPSWLSHVLNRRKDTTDYEWEVFTEAFSTFSVWKYYFGYIVASGLCLWIHPKALGWVSFPFSLGLIQAVMHPRAMPVLFAIPVIFWIMLRARHHLVIQLTTLSFLIYACIDNWKITEWARDGYYEHGSANFHVIKGWFVLKGTSYCFDTLAETDATSFGGLLELIKYTFYFPLTLLGPVVSYNTYRAGMNRRSFTPINLAMRIQETKMFIVGIIRVLFWFVFLEIALHYLYFRNISWNPELLYKLDWPSLFGVALCLSSLMQIKYVIFYGIAKAFVGYDGIDTLPLPKCVLCVHRSSILWKIFDRGLYNNLVQCIYVPTIKFMCQIDSTKNWKPMTKELVASVVTFGFIVGWHAGHPGVYWWVGLNFIAVTIERVGGAVRRSIDRKINIRPVIWDFVIEPIVLIPLTTFSLITSVIFSGNLETARVIIERLLWEMPYGWIPVIYLLNNLGIYARFWNRATITKSKKPMEKVS